MLESLLFASRVLILDVCLPILDFGSDLYNGYLYYINSDIWWATFTILFMTLPGFLEVVYWMASLITNYRETKMSSFCWYSIVFGPILFPISTFIWNLQALFRGSHYYKKKYSMALVFRSLEAFGESAPQLLLQATIMMITWKSLSHHVWQLVSVLTSVLFLSKTSAEHHFNELSGKTLVVRMRDIFPGILFFAITILIRTFLLSILIAYFKWWIVAFLTIIIIINYIASRYIFQQYLPAKDIWTSICSVVSPMCFVGKEDIQNLNENRPSNPPRLFRNFYIVNTVLTLLMSAIMIGILGVLLYFRVAYFNYTCESTPIFSCVLPSQGLTTNEEEQCRICAQDENPHDMLFYYVFPIWAGLAILHLIVVSIYPCIFPKLMTRMPIQRK